MYKKLLKIFNLIKTKKKIYIIVFVDFILAILGLLSQGSC